MICARCKRSLDDINRGWYELAYSNKSFCGRCIREWFHMQDNAWQVFMGKSPFTELQDRGIGLSSARQQGITG